MQLIDADKAQHGLTIVANSQTDGKGQRGKTWTDAPGNSLLMSIIVQPKEPISAQFAFNASIAVAIANVLAKLNENWRLHIKWPNDIIINDKKAGGILIENVLRGSKWTHAVIGLGLNANQTHFNDNLPFATSLSIHSGENYIIKELMYLIRNEILKAINHPMPVAETMRQYNNRLYKKGQLQVFGNGVQEWQATVLSVADDGLLDVQLTDGTIVRYSHGQVMWIWQ
jgi:BirA family biotin operon repressor/biotin-[acetyl-CoA-carboxylase] ligase